MARTTAISESSGVERAFGQRAAPSPRLGGGLAVAWRDRSGRFSWLRLAAFLLVLGPGLWLALLLATGGAGVEPIETALDITGVWTVRFLLLSLAVTPLRRVLRWNKLIQIRRMLGLAAAVYVGLHFGFYLLDQGLDLVRAFSEIFLRFYLTIGFAALAGLAILAATSTDRWIRRLGTGWNLLHRLAYPIAALALWHFLLQSKLDAAEATWMAGLFALLMAYRLAARWRVELTPLRLALLAVVSIPLVMGFELLWYATATSLPIELVWGANFDFAGALRPAWLTGIAGLALAGCALSAALLRRYRGA